MGSPPAELVGVGTLEAECRADSVDVNLVVSHRTRVSNRGAASVLGLMPVSLDTHVLVAGKTHSEQQTKEWEGRKLSRTWM